MNTYNLCFKQLNIQQIDAIVQCRDSLIESSFLRETFVKPDTDYLEYILLGAGIMIGVFYDNTLLGFASYVTPSKAKTDLTKFITKNKNNIIQFEHAIIAPKWQGNGYLYMLLQHLNKYSLEQNYNAIISTVHPSNFPSLKTAFKIHQSAINLDFYYGNELRFIMYGNILHDKITTQSPDYLSLPYADLKGISDFLNKGYEIYDINPKMRTYLLRRYNENTCKL